MNPSLGRIVHYRLSAEDVVAINRRRTTRESIRVRLEDAGEPRWPAGAQAHIGNEVKEGQTFPMMIVAVWGSTPESAVNGQVFLDGTDVFWATSVCVGEGPRTWSWPPRA